MGRNRRIWRGVQGSGGGNEEIPALSTAIACNRFPTLWHGKYSAIGRTYPAILSHLTVLKIFCEVISNQEDIFPGR